jgi:Protein of unknown function (DUF1116)
MPSPKTKLLEASPLKVINIGLESFGDELAAAGAPVVTVEWQPPAGGDPDTLARLNRLWDWPEAARRKVSEANAEAAQRLLTAKPMVRDIRLALEAIPGMHERMILHAGPPVAWDQMSGPLRGGVIGGLLYEGLAASVDEAEVLAASGEIEFSPCHHHDTVGPMAGIVTAKMPVWEVHNEAHGSTAYCTLNEGLGKVLRYGAYDDEVIERLRWMDRELAPALRLALAAHGPLDLRSLIAQALQMGDEGHNRNRAGTSLLIRELAPYLVETELPRAQVARVLRFLHENDHFFLNLTMPAAKASVMPLCQIPWSTAVSVMARNGTEFGIRLAGLGERWFCGPASEVDGLYLPGFSAADAGRDIGDSVITETSGIGGFAMAAAPAIVQFVGGQAADAFRCTNRMFSITLAESEAYKIPALDFRGTPTGIDVVKVVERGILPAINTGIAHKDPGVGMVGAGLVKPPARCFRDALVAFVDHYDAEARG